MPGKPPPPARDAYEEPEEAFRKAITMHGRTRQVAFRRGPASGVLFVLLVVSRVRSCGDYSSRRWLHFGNFQTWACPVRILGEDVKALTGHFGSRNASCYWVGASTTRSVVMMAKMPSASRTGTERVIIQTSPPPASK